jgi:hypothetical protein
MCEYNVYAQCVQLGMPHSRSIPLEGRLMNCFHGLPLQRHIFKKVVHRTVSMSILCLLTLKQIKYYGFLAEFGKFAMGKKDKEKKKGKGAAKTAEKTEKKQKTKVKKELAAKGKNCELNIKKLRVLRG